MGYWVNYGGYMFTKIQEGGEKTMTNLNNNRSKASDTEFSGELTQSKKARKRAAREIKNKK